MHSVQAALPRHRDHGHRKISLRSRSTHERPGRRLYGLLPGRLLIGLKNTKKKWNRKKKKKKNTTKKKKNYSFSLFPFRAFPLKRRRNRRRRSSCHVFSSEATALSVLKPAKKPSYSSTMSVCRPWKFTVRKIGFTHRNQPSIFDIVCPIKVMARARNENLFT